MDWVDDAIVLSARAYGDTGAILEALTREHGRHAGLVHGGASHKARAMLQPGNTLRVQWRGRLSEQLGSFSAEPVRMRAGTLMENRSSLAGINALVAVANAVLPEREPHAPVFAAAEILLDTMADGGFAHWAPLYIRWELGVLEALGFGLDLSRCAVTGLDDDLAYVSPRSGRAVSRPAAGIYANRLFPLPGFLLGAQNSSRSFADIGDGLKLSAHFLLHRVLAPHGQDLPAARMRLTELAVRESL
jgi:DNA repair protein RecO (recombination protein O)